MRQSNQAGIESLILMLEVGLVDPRQSNQAGIERLVGYEVVDGVEVSANRTKLGLKVATSRPSRIR